MVAVTLALLLNPVLRHRIEPGQLPCERVTGVAREGGSWLVGGLHGLYLGKPGGPWKTVSNQAVKSISSSGGEAWVIYGNGSVDKVDVKDNRLFYDVLSEAKRPWVDFMAPVGNATYFGGQGGFVAKTASGLTECYPAELKGLPVNALAQAGQTLWMGTQDGVFSYRNGKVKRFGFGSGLHDVWVTAMLPSENSVVVGLAAGGLALISGDQVEDLASPSKRVRSLFRWKDHVVLGSLEGTWIRTGETWTKIADGETYFVASTVDAELVVGCRDGLLFFG